MEISFSATRPSGDYALVLPVGGKDQAALTALGDQATGVRAALARQRFEGEAASAVELFIDDSGTVRRLLVVGTGAGTSPADAAEKFGGTIVSRLLMSGETNAVIDLTGRNYDADA